VLIVNCIAPLSLTPSPQHRTQFIWTKNDGGCQILLLIV